MVLNLRIPPRIHIFFWLLSNNKTLTRTNLAKRKTLEDISCLFCAEDESVHHLFFGCCVATLMWKYLYDIFNIQIGVNFESIARWWISNKKNSVLNMCGACITMVHLETKKRYVFSGEELEGREGTTKQVATDVGVLATVVQGGKCGEAELGDQIIEDQKPTTSTAGRNLSREGDFYTVNIGSAVIRVRNIHYSL